MDLKKKKKKTKKKNGTYGPREDLAVMPAVLELLRCLERMSRRLPAIRAKPPLWNMAGIKYAIEG